MLAYSSSRIHVIDAALDRLMVKRELKILRRPLSATITDDGSLLAVLSTDLNVNLYDLTSERPKHIRVVTLENTPRTIALSPTGSVLAAAYDNGIEVVSLDPDFSSNGGRAVKCYTVDAMSFSRNGTQILGTTLQSQNPSTVVLSAPYFSPEGQLTEQSVSALWTTSILFPNGSRDCSHAVLLPNAFDGEASWTFTYDRVFETFRAVRIDDLRNGTTYFTGPAADVDTTSKLLPSTLPCASGSGDLVAAGFHGSIWIYGVPEELDASPAISNGSNSSTDSEVTTPSSQTARRNSGPSLQSANRREPSNSRAPQWQPLYDKFRNTFVQGRKISSLDGVKSLSWVDGKDRTSLKERLIAVAPGVGTQPSLSEVDGMNPVDGGRISILDFDYTTNDGRKEIITIEVGAIEPEVLEEEQRDIDTEVAIVRRRTVAQRRGRSGNVTRSATRVVRPHAQALPSSQVPTSLPSEISHQLDPLENAEIGSIDEDPEVFDAPYSQSAPRSVNTLRRAATAAAANRRLNPRAVAGDHIEYRRADGREEHPHESDADNWVPPPPPYSKEPVSTVPEYLQRAVLGDTLANLQRANTQRSASIISRSDSSSLHRSHTTISSRSNSNRQYENTHRSFGDPTIRNFRANNTAYEIPRPATNPVASPVSPDFDDLYDVSPPESPRLAPVTQVGTTTPHQIRRRPVGANPGVDSTPGSDISVPTNTLLPPHSESPSPQTPQRVADVAVYNASSQEPAIKYDHTPSPSLGTSTYSGSIAGAQMHPSAPARVNEGHHLTEPVGLPALVPSIQNNSSWERTLPQRSQTDPEMIATGYPEERSTAAGPLPTWRRVDTAPAGLAGGSIDQASSGLTMPTTDQIARLHTRGKRPPSLPLADPSGRKLSSFNQSRDATSSNTTNSSPGIGRPAQHPTLQINAPQNLTSPAPRLAHAVQGPSSSSDTRISSHTSRVSHSQYSPRYSSPSNQNPQHAPSLGVHSQRLETIYSASSGATTPNHTPRAIGIGRQPSRAERSAAKNIKDAKKKGWKASTKKKKKDKFGDGASSAGWTDVTMDDSPKRKESGGKCIMM